ncbi:type II secretion system protein GspC [Aeromonas cavernicola]|uniref:Type II secretion system protein GspC n=2 Tax=Aeromonas cavernicola TaxID=1006623 RepID=A0A2H9U295_9GAMM|nr:type II secretion system protein GspC [Aeromonas cavernicola]
MTPLFRDERLTLLLASCRRLPFAKLNYPLFWALLLLLAQQCASLTWHVLAMVSAPPSAPWQPAMIDSPTNSRAVLNLNQLQQLSLFGKAPTKEKTVAAVAVDAPRTQLNAQLNGVLASSVAAKSIAIVTMAGRQNSYGIGDLIDGTQATIRQILADRVILELDGRDETLMLDGEEYGKAPSQATLPTVSLTTVRNELLKNPRKINDYFNISPVQVDGRMVGYRLNPGNDPTLFNQTGLQANDLAVSVNDLDLRDNMQAMQAMEQMAGASEMTVTVERQGALLDIYFGLSE